jgi:hypothetical protein
MCVCARVSQRRRQCACVRVCHSAGVDVRVCVCVCHSAGVNVRVCVYHSAGVKRMQSNNMLWRCVQSIRQASPHSHRALHSHHASSTMQVHTVPSRCSTRGRHTHTHTHTHMCTHTHVHTHTHTHTHTNTHTHTVPTRSPTKGRAHTPFKKLINESRVVESRIPHHS